MNQTINDKLDNIARLQSSIEDNSKICESFLRRNSKVSDNEKVNEDQVLELIHTIQKEISIFKNEQLEISDINYSSTLVFKGKEYRVIELIKLKEAHKLKLDFLINCSKILNQETQNLDLTISIMISNLRKDYQELHKILNQFNQRTSI